MPIDSYEGVINNTQEAIAVPIRLILKLFDLPRKSPILPKIIAPIGLAIIATAITK
ncbi:MAG: hypothetical protein Tsb006_3740 [Rickettsiaceae bacterium]